ncbi:MAG: TolC family protein [Blastocatellia bacterium]|nr:TolC family protein [Blastocatellia bacterium]
MMSTRVVALGALVLLMSIVGAAQAQVRLTLREAEEIAVRNHPQINAALLNAQAANLAPAEIGAVRYPTLQANLNGAGATSDARIGAGGLNNPLILSRGAAGISISQSIFDFGRTNSLVESARLKAKASDQAAEATRAQVLLQVDRAYFLALRAQALLKVAEQTVAARQLVVEQVEALRQSGLKSGLDVSIASYNLSEARLLASKAQNEVKAAHADLAAALGNRDEQVFELADEVLPADPVADSSVLVKDALLKRPELRGLQFERDAAYQFLKAEKSLKMPSITGLWNAGWIPFGDSRLSSRYSAAGFSISIPIFNGRLYKTREAEAEFKARAVEQILRESENRVARDVRIAWLNINSAFERIGLSAQLLNRANEALDLAQERYRLGLSSIVELSQAQLNVTIAQIESTNTKYDYLLQRAVLNYQSAQSR